MASIRTWPPDARWPRLDLSIYQQDNSLLAMGLFPDTQPVQLPSWQDGNSTPQPRTIVIPLCQSLSLIVG